MKNTILFFLAFTSFTLINAQPGIQWQKCLGGSSDDWAQSIQPTIDSGYIGAGYALSNNGDVSGNNGNYDFWIAKLDNAGTIEWQKCLGGSNPDNAYSVQQTADSGYVVAGFTASNDSDVSGNHCNDDFWIVKLDNAGNIQWQKCLGGSNYDDAFFVRQTTDGGYIVSGDTESSNGDVTGHHGNYDAWIVKLDSAGNIQWQKCLGGSGDETASSVRQTTDGGYIVSGSATSNDGDVSGNHGGWDVWIVKLDSAGNILWQKCFGGTGEDIGYSIQQTADSGYVVAGFTKSTNGDVSGIHGSGAQPDYWIVKLDSTGNLQWQKCLGGLGDDKAYSISQTNDSGYVVAGFTRSNDGDVSGNHGTGSQDYWIVKLTVAGTIQWQTCLGGSGNDWARSIQQTADSGYVVAGWAASNNGDVNGNHGSNDYWIVKLHDNATDVEEYGAPVWNIFPNPSTGVFSITGSAIQNAVLTISNPLGQVIYQSPVTKEKTDVDLSAYPAGIYFVTVADENQKWTERIIIE
ncbi:MAG TPA: T9SS type A sorting domain-containing protein [Bacteroidia bacterium]|nr:T9SS type A sorting domain-containing protein [Bacteroidia bacterium]